jgi:opacity protein-like surface antigen
MQLHLLAMAFLAASTRSSDTPAPFFDPGRTTPGVAGGSAGSAPGPLLSPDEADNHDSLGENGLYLQFNGGLTTTTDSDGPGEEINFDEGFALSGAIGSRFGANDGNATAFDLEFEVIYTDQDADDEGLLESVTDVTVFGGLVNGIFDFALGQSASLYAGGGIGASMLEVGTESDALNDFEEEDGPFLTWQLKGGVRYWASQHVALNLGYRFLNVDDAEIDDDLGSAEFDLQTEQHIVELGVRFQL